MALVTFKDLCIDANDVPAIQGFWANALHLDSEFFDDDGTAVLRGEVPAQTVWINLVPEAREVKNRVHLDLVARSLEPFAGLERVTEPGEHAWTTLLDPEGNQFCVFTAEDHPTVGRPDGLKDVVVDSADHRAIATWWADVWGGEIGHDDDYTYLDAIPGAPVESFDFVPVPEPKTVKNRIHWDVTLNEGVTVDDLVAKGATVLAPPDEDARWTVMADPEGNEFCVFERQ
ncbi:MAG: VOC family protein [Aeromicrobium sp.]